MDPEIWLAIIGDLSLMFFWKELMFFWKEKSTNAEMRFSG